MNSYVNKDLASCQLRIKSELFYEDLKIKSEHVKSYNSMQYTQVVILVCQESFFSSIHIMKKDSWQADMTDHEE